LDVFERCEGFLEARHAQAAGIYPYFLAFDDHDAATARLNGREVVMCGSNNYLGLTRDERVLAAASEAVGRYGSSCTGSRLLNGSLRLHEELEQELADFFDMPAALVFSTGYQANLGAIAALAGPGDVVLVDREAHASIFDACRLSRASMRVFQHNDPDHLRSQLERRPADVGCLVVVDGVYSMGGDVCPVPDILEVCRQYSARLMVDDAHGAGVLAAGKGTCAYHGISGEADLLTLTFSKAFASLGGAVLGQEQVIHYIRHHASSQIFSASMTPSSTAAALAAVCIARREPWRAARALDHGSFMAAELARLGLDTGRPETPIVPVRIARTEATALAWRALLDRGVYVNAVLPPAASARLRTSYTAAHTREQLQFVLKAFAEVADELRPAEPASA
jgi:8-amino-7-oxononanoate synthase